MFHHGSSGATDAIPGVDQDSLIVGERDNLIADEELRVVSLDLQEHMAMRVRVTDEARDVWLLYLSRALNGNISKFDDALQHAKDDDQRSKV